MGSQIHHNILILKLFLNKCFLLGIPHMTNILPHSNSLVSHKKIHIYIFSLSKARTVTEDVLLAVIDLQVISGEPSSSVLCLPEYHPTAYNAGCTVTTRTCSMFTASGLV